MNKVLVNFEKAIGLGPTKAARLLGVAYVTYAQVRSGARPLQKYHARHIECLLVMPRVTLAKLIEEHVNGN